jgi:hypothetical protein
MSEQISIESLRKRFEIVKQQEQEVFNPQHVARRLMFIATNEQLPLQAPHPYDLHSLPTHVKKNIGKEVERFIARAKEENIYDILAVQTWQETRMLLGIPPGEPTIQHYFDQISTGVSVINE